MLTFLDGLAVLVNICAAGFCKGRVVAVVVDLHLDEVEDLILAGGGGQLVLVLRQAPQHLAPTGSVHGHALVGTQAADVYLTSLIQSEVEPAHVTAS